LEGGPPIFGQGFTCPALLEDQRRTLPVRGCHPLRPAFPDRSGCSPLAAGLIRFRSPLLAESRLMSFPRATEMFQFARFASRAYGLSSGYPIARVGCPIRRPPDQSLLATPRSFSQPATSFFASRRQGIRQTPFSRLISNAFSWNARPCAGAGAPQAEKPGSPAPLKSASMKTRKHRDAALRTSDVRCRMSGRHRSPASRAKARIACTPLHHVKEPEARSQGSEVRSRPASPKPFPSSSLARRSPSSDFRLLSSELWS
jgi:hypothetical protein